MHNKHEKTSDTELTVGLWCNAAFGTHVCSTPYDMFLRDDVKNDVIVYLHKLKFS